jgi:amino acid transporter
LYAALVFLISVFGSFVWLAAMSALVRVLIYMACIGAMPRLRRRFGGQPGSFTVPGGWITAVGAFVVSGVLLLQVRPSSVLVTAAVLAVGAVVHWASRRRSALPNSQDGGPGGPL